LNNCDHFATWCKIGEHHSIQVDLAKKILVEAGKYLDKFRKKYTIFEEGAEILSAIYKIAEIFSSPEIKR
jgi:predicted transcriptional regulator